MSVLNKKEERARRWRYKLERIFSCQNLHAYQIVAKYGKFAKASIRM